MAIRALKQEHTKVVQPVHFSDVSEEHWAYNDIQKALYFDLISCDKEGDLFRPDDSVSRAESLSVAVNALTTETIVPIGTLVYTFLTYKSTIEAIRGIKNSCATVFGKGVHF